MKKDFAKISDANGSRFTGLLKFVSFAFFTKPGFDLLKRIIGKYLVRTLNIHNQALNYNDWIKEKTDPAVIKSEFNENINNLKLKPKITIIIAGSAGADNKQLATAISSVIDQSYSNWELYIDNASQILAQKDDRIRLTTQKSDYTKANLYHLIDESAGPYILFMMPQDTLTPNCLFEVIKHINNHPSDMLIYTDEDALDNNGQFSSPHFKPGWSPDTLLSRNYIGHTIIIKKEVFANIKPAFKENNSFNFYDLILRSSEITNNIGHIPKILFHSGNNTFTEADNIASKNAINDALIRRGTPATITEVPSATACYYIKYEITQPRKVSIIIPTKDNTQLLKTAVDSILQKTEYPDYEIIVLNNNSNSDDFFRLVKEYEKTHHGIFRCIDANFPFNFAKLMNLGVAQSNGAYILMCNNDIEVINNDWMTQMVSYTQHNQTGAVGVKLLYPDNTIQHAGIILGTKEASRHIYANRPADDSGYFNSLKAVTNYSAVTAACMMCRKEVYDKAGGMDETLEVEYNDIDFCLRLIQNGFYNLYIPSVVLYHHESATRGHPFRSIAAYKQHEKDLAVFKSKWQQLIDNDPFYNTNLNIAFT